ncbi:class I SAM-dependent methyltransferase [Aquisphaera insulae]|uniref:class I SAM-dependent methyltransferase n=1 Tax=Aquisphaera insulae TaxID=2712864 RepID=UPI0013EC8D72|nr:class I SAM-dependent methyltransferase [Aquisphaera insulae]
MDHREAGRFWDGNADAWTELARAGCDVYRDHLNTPAFLEWLPDVRGRSGLDIGCGEGHNTRLLAHRGARMTGVDISERFVGHARAAESGEPLGVDYRVASAVELPFADDTFDFATAFMSLMDIPETDRVLAEAARVLRPGGFLQFSICHPCFDTPHRRNLRDASGITYAIEVGDYFRELDGEVQEWLFGEAPAEAKARLPRFRVPRFTRTISRWIHEVLSAGFSLEGLSEPRPSDEAVRACPAIQDAQVVSYFLHVRARKAGGACLRGLPNDAVDRPPSRLTIGSTESETRPP